MQKEERRCSPLNRSNAQFLSIAVPVLGSDPLSWVLLYVGTLNRLTFGVDITRDMKSRMHFTSNPITQLSALHYLDFFCLSLVSEHYTFVLTVTLWLGILICIYD